MKKGFLLSKKNSPLAKNHAPSLTDPAPRSPSNSDVCDGNSNSCALNIIPHQKQQPPAPPTPTTSTIKRGFLLNRSNPSLSKVASNDSGKSSILPQPQCRLNPNEERSTKSSKSKRVTTRSTALLDTSFNEDCGASAKDDGYNPHAKTTSSLLHFIGDDESDSDEGETSPAYENSLEFLQYEGKSDDGNPSLDNWIEPSSSSSSLPSIIFPPATHQSGSSQCRKPRTSKQRKTLIVEMDDIPTIRGTCSNTNFSTPCITSSTNDIVEPRPIDHVVHDNKMRESDPILQPPQSTNADRGDDIREGIVATPKDSRQFINTVSILLSKLGRSIHNAKQHKNIPRPNDKDAIVIGIGTIVNTPTAALIRSFVAKDLSNLVQCELLDSVWQMILEPIAQDYTEFLQSRNRTKKRSRFHNISPSLTLGLGILDFIKPVDVAYGSLVRQLHTQLIETTTVGSNQDTQKQHKILTLGAVYLLRCRIRCITISLTKLESGLVADASHSDTVESMRQAMKNFESEIGILLSRVLPSLESIVSDSSARNGQTVLTSAAADACFELIEISSRSVIYCHRLQASDPAGVVDNETKLIDSMKTWKGVLHIIERLLAVKQRWITSSGCSPSRSSCATAILIDWLDVIKSAKRLYFNYLVEDGLLEGYDYSAGLNLFINLSGILLRKADVDNSSEITYLRVGGIAQSCQYKECVFGSILTPVYGSDSDIVSLLQESSRLTESIRDAKQNISTSADVCTKINRQRAAVRAFASWISSGNKAIRVLTKSSQNIDDNLLDSSMTSLVMMLRSESQQCVDLSIAALSFVWSECPDWGPQSFEDLLDALQAHSTLAFDENGTPSTLDEFVLSPTCRALCMIVANIASRKPSSLLPPILNMKGRIELVIEVVLEMLSMLSTNPSPREEKYSIYLAASDILIEHIASVPHLRSRLRSNPSLYTNVPCNYLIPKIVEYLVDRYAKRKSSDAGVSSLAGVLCNIMKNSVESGRAEEFMRYVILSLQNIDEIEKNPGKSSTTFFNKNGSLWRLALCNNTSTSDSAYSDILLAAAKSMIEMPTSSTPLTALASLVDDQFDGKSSTDDIEGRVETRIFIATSGIIQFSMNEILSLPNNDDEMSIFSRLAPLLILRRLPRSYYRIVHARLFSDKDTRDAVARLASCLADALNTLAVKDSPSSLDTEQKRLIAELLGHCLPLTSSCIVGSRSLSDSNELQVSLYDIICRRPFSIILTTLRVDQDDETQFDLDKIRMSDVSQAKAALYAICHHVPLAINDDDGEKLVNVASFAFEILNWQPAAASRAATAQVINEMILLQSGCAHFLAVCVDSLSYRKRNFIEAVHSTPLIVDLDIQNDSSDFPARNSTIGALSQIFNALVAIVLTGETNSGVNHTTTHFLPLCRNAMLNSIVMLVQSSKADDNRIHWLASNLLPPLVEWTSRGPIDENIYHPLCLAASLQVIYTVLARCGTGRPGSISVSDIDFVCRTLQCALTSFHTSEASDAPAITALRLAALKVILTVLALHQSKELESADQNLKGYLSHTEIQKAISAMHGAANVDQNPEVRRLANQILPHIIHR